MNSSAATEIDLQPGRSAIDAHRMIVQIARIRAFELKLLELFSQGKLFGTTHTCVGQEAGIVALYQHLDRRRDAVFTNHRCHGHFLAFGGSMRALLAEIMGKPGAVCGGRGGSQHLCDGRFFSQGIQGGGLPLAAGYAWQMKRRGDKGIVVAHIGDGTLGEGIVYETLNLIALLRLPLLVVLEHNCVAQSTDTARTTAGDVAARFSAFGLAVDRRGALDPLAIVDHLGDVVDRVRRGTPQVQILDTFRLMAHSKGDDDRPAEILAAAWNADFLSAALQRQDSAAVDAWRLAQAEVERVAAELDALPAEPLGRCEVFAPAPQPWFESSGELGNSPSVSGGLRLNQLLNRALDHCLASDANLLVIGEDLLDPYGGAFKVTRGLSTKYPDRVFSTPISEAAIVGLGTGAALAGGKAVVEIMFGDFAALAVDQIVNQAAKMHFMYNGQVRVPTTVRLVSGGYRGYGPTHSQCLERLFCGVPGLKVVAISRRHDVEKLAHTVILRDPNPVVLVEHKLLYSLQPHDNLPPGFQLVSVRNQPGEYPPLGFSTVDSSEREPTDATVVTYGGMTDLVEAAMHQLILSDERNFDYFILTQLSPLNCEAIADSARRTGRLVVIEEGVGGFGVGAAVVAAVAATLGDRPLRSSFLGAADIPIPSSRLQELEALPSQAQILRTIEDLWT